MTDTPHDPAQLQQAQALIDRYAAGDRSTALTLLALVRLADEQGIAGFHDVAVELRTAYLDSLRAEGRDADAEAGRISLDEVRTLIATVLVPRLTSANAIRLLEAPSGNPAGARLQVVPSVWETIRPIRGALLAGLRHTGEHPMPRRPSGAPHASHNGNVLEARGLIKTYRKRNVVNDVRLSLRQGEIVGLLGPNGAGKTTTFYMIVGLIPPAAGQILYNDEDITAMPMYQRARRGIGYLSQEPSIFRKLTVEENILAILETLDMSRADREAKLEMLLSELNITHLRKSKAFALSGGERRRLEITRALVTEPSFMMLDEPFAGVDPIAVHDIQQIVAGLKDRGIGVLISDHNVEQTLDIVDRAYIMFDGQVKVSGTVRELVFDDIVAKNYLGPTLAARLRARFIAEQESPSALAPTTPQAAGGANGPSVGAFVPQRPL